MSYPVGHDVRKTRPSPTHGPQVPPSPRQSNARGGNSDYLLAEISPTAIVKFVILLKCIDLARESCNSNHSTTIRHVEHLARPHLADCPYVYSTVDFLFAQLKLIGYLVGGHTSTLVKRRSGGGVQLSRDPLNLLNLHTPKVRTVILKIISWSLFSSLCITV